MAGPRRSPRRPRDPGPDALRLRQPRTDRGAAGAGAAAQPVPGRRRRDARRPARPEPRQRGDRRGGHGLGRAVGRHRDQHRPPGQPDLPRPRRRGVRPRREPGGDRRPPVGQPGGDAVRGSGRRGRDAVPGAGRASAGGRSRAGPRAPPPVPRRAPRRRASRRVLRHPRRPGAPASGLGAALVPRRRDRRPGPPGAGAAGRPRTERLDLRDPRRRLHRRADRGLPHGRVERPVGTAPRRRFRRGAAARRRG
ncbi:hypothetical protein SAMN02799636_00321 [Methylobacterium sp. 275MFSha3.1]|nr:hypothetical protein SAMN02799636_00321 [Methylobacterium sp. 275MFSha3.1]